MWLVHLEDADGVDVGRSGFPSTQEHDGGALCDVPLLLAFADGCQETILDVVRPVRLHRLCVVEWVDPAVEVALERGRSVHPCRARRIAVFPLQRSYYRLCKGL